MNEFVSATRCSCSQTLFVFDEETGIQYPIHPVPPQDNRICTQILYHVQNEIDLATGWIACDDLERGKDIQFLPLAYHLWHK
jgi:hypothetical protein